jgi:transposase
MRCFAGLDVSLETTNVCVMDAEGVVLRESKLATEPEAMAAWFKETGLGYGRIGLEASATAMWLFRGLAEAGLPIICIEARHAHGVLKARLNKTDRNDANGIADLMRVGLFKAVHVKTLESQHVRALLTARRTMRIKLVDLENAIGGILRSLGFNLRRPSRLKFDARVQDCLAQAPEISAFIQPLLDARSMTWAQFEVLDERVASLARADPVCRRLMTIPGVGPLVALTYRATIDIPQRFSRSRTVAAHLGLTPRTYQSGRLEMRGRITRFGDRHARTALVNAAMAALHPRTRTSPLKVWGLCVAERRGKMKAAIAVARRLAVLMHRLWVDGADFRVDPVGA